MTKALAFLAILAALAAGGAHPAGGQGVVDTDPRVKNFDPSKLVRFATPAEADAKRMELIHYIWADGLPVKALPTVTAGIGTDVFKNDLTGLDGALAASVDRLDATIAPYDFHSTSYLIHPLAKTGQAGRLVIVHSGHRQKLDEWAGEDALIDRLLSEGYTVLAMDLPLFGWNARNLTVRLPKDGGAATLTAYDHEKMFEKLLPALPKDGAIYRFFLEPVVQGVNYYLGANPGADVSMIGLSGGGWTTHMLAAVDVRIRRSFPVAGSYPMYARSKPFPAFSHDIEQDYVPLYGETDSNGDGITDTAAGVASWLEIYVLGGYGPGRRQTQILNYYDACCFFGDAYKTYAGFVSRSVRNLGQGEWDFYSDTTHKVHQISPDVLEKVILPGLGGVAPSAQAAPSSSAEDQTVIGEYPHPSAMEAVQLATGLTARNDREVLEVTVCGDSRVHVVARPKGAPASSAARPWMLAGEESCPGAAFQFSQSGDLTTLTTARISVSLSAAEGSLIFKTPDGQTLIRETGSLPRAYLPAGIKGLYRIEDRFSPDAVEAIYGLGQHQSGLFNYRGSTVELGQQNTDVAIPLLVSSKGYGILWNTASFSYMDNRFPLEINFSSMAAEQVDYYVLYGPEMDRVIHEYRTMTGHAPLFPEWAYGLFQSKDRYKTQAEMLEIAGQYRSRHIPMDAIVQDWFWWKEGGQGDPEFNSGYTDVPAELKALHDEHVHAMVSVWGMMDAGSKNFKEIQRQGFEIPGAHVYDPTNPAARDFFWNQLAGKLFAQGWDAFWLDSAEPEEYWPHLGDAILRYKPLHIGSGLEYTNIFPLEHTDGVQEHWKEANREKRVFLLTRSAFMGQQRNGAAVWSGDVYSTWWALKHQVAAGLNFALSGYPYWTTDIGGYHQPYDGAANEPGYQELYARWFEYGAFCPVFRTHGHRDHNELWTYDRVFPELLAFDRLRYRLLPYVYSAAWKMTNDDYTIQRPLVMDFREDRGTWEIGDEFLFGPAMLVSPVTKEHATERTVYLPAGSDWYDFWTGAQAKGGAEVTRAAPIEKIPLEVRAGSILPLGPVVEYAGQATDPIELRIYPGANGDLNLYEDEGDSYRYQKGAHSIVPIHWQDASRTLTIGAREGSYKGMASGHTFNVVIVRNGRGVGGEVTPAPDKAIQYTGSKLEARF